MEGDQLDGIYNDLLFKIGKVREELAEVELQHSILLFTLAEAFGSFEKTGKFDKDTLDYFKKIAEKTPWKRSV